MSVRADKFLWAVRLYKTRGAATEALQMKQILVNDSMAKPSRALVVGDVLSVKHLPAVFTFRIKELLDKRVGAALVADYLENMTPQSELDKLEMARLDTNGKRDRGAGRPTKRDRREIEDFFDND